MTSKGLPNIFQESTLFSANNGMQKSNFCQKATLTFCVQAYFRKWFSSLWNLIGTIPKWQLLWTVLASFVSWHKCRYLYGLSCLNYNSSVLEIHLNILLYLNNYISEFFWKTVAPNHIMNHQMYEKLIMFFFFLIVIEMNRCWQWLNWQIPRTEAVLLMACIKMLNYLR